MCACPGVRSLQVVLRWGLRVAAGLRGGGCEEAPLGGVSEDYLTELTVESVTAVF